MPNIHLTHFEHGFFKIITMPCLRCVGRCTHVHQYSTKQHAHPMMEMVYVVSGNGSVSIGGDNYPISPGSLAIYNPHTPHAEVFDTSDTAPFFYHIKFDEFMIHGLPVNTLLPGAHTPVIDAGECADKYESLFRLMFVEAENQSLGYVSILNNLLQCVVQLTIRLLDYPALLSARNGNEKLFEQIQQYMIENYALPLSMQGIADHFHINRCYLSHIVKKNVDMAPVTYLSEFRINEACRLLLQTTLSIREIAQKVGYRQLSSFYMQFKKRKALTPIEYRERYEKTPVMYVQDGYEK